MNQAESFSGDGYGLPYDYEYEIQWDKDIIGLDYIREKMVRTRKRDGIPDRIHRDDYTIYGWSNINSDSPTMVDGLVEKRIFYLKDGDINTDNPCDWRYGSPAEAVVPNSVEAGKESEKHIVEPESVGGRWWDNVDEYVNREGETVSDFVGIPLKSRYVIRLVDENKNHWLYVGESNNVVKRLRTHEMRDGDFTKPESSLTFFRVEEVRNDKSERELYKEVCQEYNIPNKRILGGR